MPRALCSTFSAVTWLPQQFQLFHPMAGVSEMLSPTTMRNFFSLLPKAFWARSTISYFPALVSVPVISPVAESTCRPAGSFLTENSMGLSPVAGMRYKKGEPGRTPKIDGPWMRGVGGGAGVRLSGISSPRADARTETKTANNRGRILIFIFQPEQKMGDGDVAPDLFIGNFGSHFLPKANPFWIAQGQPRQEKRRLAARPRVPRLHIGFVRPLRFVRQEWVKKFHRLAHAAPVRQGEGPQVVIRRRKHLAERGHVIQLKDRIAVRLGAGQLAREAPIRRHLLRDENRFELPPAGLKARLVTRELGEDGQLQVKGDGVVVLGGGFLV